LGVAEHTKRALELVVEPDEAGLRLDVVLVRRLPALSRARAKEMLEAGEVRLNDRPCRKGARLSPGDRIALAREPEPTEFAALPDAHLQLPIVHEDDWLVVVDKAAGVPSHPLRPQELGTVASALVHRFPEMAGVGYRPREPGILHRLDTGTSGLMLAARDDLTFQALLSMLQAGDIEKRYVAVVHGTPRIGPIERAIGPHPSDPRRVRVFLEGREERGARPARTDVLSVKPLSTGLSEVEVRAGAAARHQVRVHLASIGNPLVGDELYGAPPSALGRHLLHASRLAFEHPHDHRPLAFKSPLPDATRQAAISSLHPKERA
jgi:23S rRNA pseudouridine1911/1915/1917 synthase